MSFNTLAYATARLERKDATLAYLERAYDERYPFLITLKSDPIVGLTSEHAGKLDAADPTWRVNGQRAVACFGGKPK